ncbi:MAG: Gfo/Idh/MocA family oxidoreductase [Acidimicrobiia bacterium]|nr:Gfo/Idh/MocA family oxidoreductase [Acidimicrobiia bacterium]
MTTVTRRSLLINSANAAIASAMFSLSGHSRVSANDRVSVAVIGVGGMGTAHLRFLSDLKDAHIAAVCDVDEQHLRKAVEFVKTRTGQSPATAGDFRRTLDDASIDAVVIATPHHWHCPIALQALQAGKDVYVEKPAGHRFRETRLLVEAAKKYKRIVQHGTQMRSSNVLTEIRSVLDSGILGKIVMARAWNIQGKSRNLKAVPDSPVPPGVDYDRWLGPAPKHPFNQQRFHRLWRSFRDYGNGDMGDDGAHDLDLARWGLGATTHPVRITAHGNNLFEQGYREYPDNMMVSFQYADGRVLTYEERAGFEYGQNGTDSSNAVYGTDGYIIFSRRGFYRTYLGKKEEPGPAAGKAGRVGDAVHPHHQDFLNCVRTRKPTQAGAEVAHLSCALIHLGEIAFRTRTVIEFDPQTEQITNSKQANRMLTKNYRKPYGLPEAV